MAFEHPGHGALDYKPCRYGQSKLLFRGPRKRLRSPYSVFLGGTETYGKFISRPFPDLVEVGTGMMSANLGCINGGIDAYVNDADVLSIASRARVTVIQIMGAQNLSNRFYKVHPRRNDRFLKASILMRTVFREVDFTDFAFTRHLLSTLQDCSADRYGLVVEELRQAWIARMAMLIERIDGVPILLWIGRKPPPAQATDAMSTDPLFVDAAMIAALRSRVADYVEVVPSESALSMGTVGMSFPEIEAPAAAALPGPLVHDEIANALVPAINRLMT